MEDMKRLLALEEIQRLRTRYCRSIDEHRWQDLAEVLAPDCVLNLSGTARVLMGEDAPPRPPTRGRDAIIAFLGRLFGQSRMLLHICTMPDISFDGDDRASGVWRQETYIKEAYPDRGNNGIAYGTVHDDYVRIDGRWWISSVRVEIDMIL